MPAEEIDRLWRYGSAEADVALDRLSGEAWSKRRSEVEAELQATAARLVAMAREREAAEAPRLVPPTQAYRHFVDRFPYTETGDQLRAIDAALRDLASGRPMDRLVCGDVGFGKTEVALRAAAALAGKQVALAAPTGVLVRQHLETFRRRFAGFGVTVEALSRLSNGSATKAVKDGLARGSTHVVIGTHKLAAKGMSIRGGQGRIADHVRPSRRRAFAMTISFRMMAVRASFAGLPAVMSWSYLRRRSGLNRTATRAGM